mmetsp:Transcript_18424/g.37099  ORF Transcript_18424/g.37099 Transcript_18424/m.37099 type:complete len:229 (-) Transcript_18424:293-979(-)
MQRRLCRCIFCTSSTTPRPRKSWPCRCVMLAAHRPPSCIARRTTPTSAPRAIPECTPSIPSHGTILVWRSTGGQIGRRELARSTWRPRRTSIAPSVGAPCVFIAGSSGATAPARQPSTSACLSWRLTTMRWRRGLVGSPACPTARSSSSAWWRSSTASWPRCKRAGGRPRTRSTSASRALCAKPRTWRKNRRPCICPTSWKQSDAWRRPLGLRAISRRLASRRRRRNS